MSLDFDLEMEVTEVKNVFEANITHNLNTMADKAGIYECLWRAPENGYKTAGQIIPLLESGIKKMEEDPAHFKQFDAENGWGTYDAFLPWLKKVLSACREYPDSKIITSR